MNGKRKEAENWQINEWRTVKLLKEVTEGLTSKTKVGLVCLLSAYSIKEKNYTESKSNVTESEISSEEEMQEKLKKLSVWSLIPAAASSLGSFHYTPHLWLPQVQLPFVRTQRQRVMTWM